MIELREHQYKNQESWSDWYKKKFPKVSRKTMQRDFIKLGEIGYEIQYDRSGKCYEVHYVLEGLEAVEYIIR